MSIECKTDKYILTVSLRGAVSVSLAETIFKGAMVSARPESIALGSLGGRYIGMC
jgi:hypothetical protein